MKKLFVKAIEWLRSRVTALKREEGKGKSEEFNNTRGVYVNDDDNDNEDGNWLKREEEKGKREEFNNTRGVYVNDDDNEDGNWLKREEGKRKREERIVNSKLTLPQVKELLCTKYELRYNLLTEQAEYCERGSGADFRPVDKRVYMTWLLDIQAEGYNYSWLEGVRIAAESLHIPSYHPVTEYFTTLPQWDGIDRLRPLMRRLTGDEALVDYLCRWMLALVAQAQGDTDSVYGNSVAPLLVSEQQGMHKSTFCRLLLPPELREYYTDNFDLNAESRCERKLLDCLLINLDEFDRYSSRKQSTLKNLMQMTSLRMHKAYSGHSTTLPRIASFIGTSNTAALLTDPTGSRRFLCIDIRSSIDVDTPIEYAQLYAQCMQLLSQGERHWFDDTEVRDIERRNRNYRRHRPVEELFFRHYRLPREGEVPELLSAAHIYEHLTRCDARLMKGVCAQRFGAVLRGLGAVRSEHHDKRVYAVIQTNGELRMGN